MPKWNRLRRGDEARGLHTRHQTDEFPTLGDSEEDADLVEEEGRPAPVLATRQAHPSLMEPCPSCGACVDVHSPGSSSSSEVIWPKRSTRRCWPSKSWTSAVAIGFVGAATFTALWNGRRTLLDFGRGGLQPIGLAGVTTRRGGSGGKGGKAKGGKGDKTRLDRDGHTAMFPSYDGRSGFVVADEYGAARRHEISGCVGNLIAALALLADIGTTSVAANEDCSSMYGLPHEEDTVEEEGTLDQLRRALDKTQEALQRRKKQGETDTGLREAVAKVALEESKLEEKRQKVRHASSIQESLQEHGRRLKELTANFSKLRELMGMNSSGDLPLQVPVLRGRKSRIPRISSRGSAANATAEPQFARGLSAQRGSAANATAEPQPTGSLFAQRGSAGDRRRRSATSESPFMKEVEQETAADEPEPPPGDDISIYSPKRRAEIKCARDSLFMARSTAAAAARVSTSVGLCTATENKRLVDRAPCSAQVLNAIHYLAEIGGAINEMILECIPGVAYFDCAFWLEEISWDIAGLSKFMTGAIKTCADGFHIPLLPKKKKLGNSGFCVGEVFSTMGYIGSSSLQIASAAEFNCPKAAELMLKFGPRKNMTYEDERELFVARTKCARDSAAFVRTLFLALTKAVRSAGHCGSLKMVCGRDLARTLSAFAAVAEAAADVTKYCYATDEFRQFEESEEREIRQAECAAFIGAMVKMMGVAASFAYAASGSCVDTHYAGTLCGAAVGRSLAALSAMAQNSAEVHLHCELEREWFLCGRDMRYESKAFRVFALSTSTAVLNCGLSPLEHAWKGTKLVAMPRLFTYP